MRRTGDLLLIVAALGLAIGLSAVRHGIADGGEGAATGSPRESAATTFRSAPEPEEDVANPPAIPAPQARPTPAGIPRGRLPVIVPRPDEYRDLPGGLSGRADNRAFLTATAELARHRGSPRINTHGCLPVACEVASPAPHDGGSRP